MSYEGISLTIKTYIYTFTYATQKCIVPQQVICNRESKKKEYDLWCTWLCNKHVQNHMKCEELHRSDEKGWSALHYAAREYCTDILSAALKIEGGEWTLGELF